MYLLESIVSNYSNSLQADNGFFIHYAPMGSGKTYAIKHLLANQFKDRDVTIVAPYKSCRQDYNGKYSKSNSLNSEYLYPNQLIRAVTQHRKFEGCTSKQHAEDLIPVVLEDLQLDLTNKVFIFDEVDFFWFQCRREFTDIEGGKIHSDSLLTIIIDWLSSRCLVLGFTATKLESSCVSTTTLPEFSAYTHTDVTTSVHISSLTINNTNGANVDRVFRELLLESLKNTKPTLVFKTKYTEADVLAVRELKTKHNKRVLVVARKSNLSTRDIFDETIINGFADMTIADTDVTLHPTGCDFIYVEGKNASLDTAINGKDVYTHYDYVFINISSSRQVSIPKKADGVEVQVCCQGASISSSMLQAAARFRHNPINLHVWLNNTPKIRAIKHEDIIHKLEASDPTVSAYRLTKDKCSVVHRGNLTSTVGKSVGKTVSPKTAAKRASVSHFFDNYYDDTLSVLANFNNYLAEDQYEFKVGRVTFTKLIPS